VPEGYYQDTKTSIAEVTIKRVGRKERGGGSGLFSGGRFHISHKSSCKEIGVDLKSCKEIRVELYKQGKDVCAKEQVNQYNTSFSYYFVHVFNNFLSRSSSLYYFVEKSIRIDAPILLFKMGSRVMYWLNTTLGITRSGNNLYRCDCLIAMHT
jgi:hypothetical protein